MAASYDQICKQLKEIGISHKLDKDASGNKIIRVGFRPQKYINSDGDKYINVIIELLEEGQFIKIYAPQLYNYDGLNKYSVFQTCVMISWLTKMAQYEYDVRSNEIRLIIEWPLEDAILTTRQLKRALLYIPLFADDYHDTFVKSMATGEIEFADASDDIFTQLRKSLINMEPAKQEETLLNLSRLRSERSSLLFHGDNDKIMTALVPILEG